MTVKYRVDMRTLFMHPRTRYRNLEVGTRRMIWLVVTDGVLFHPNGTLRLAIITPGTIQWTWSRMLATTTPDTILWTWSRMLAIIIPGTIPWTCSRTLAIITPGTPRRACFHGSSTRTTPAINVRSIIRGSGNKCEVNYCVTWIRINPLVGQSWGPFGPYVN
jgi:hypothetical protein